MASKRRMPRYGINDEHWTHSPTWYKKGASFCTSVIEATPPNLILVLTYNTLLITVPSTHPQNHACKRGGYGSKRDVPGHGVTSLPVEPTAEWGRTILVLRLAQLSWGYTRGCLVWSSACHRTAGKNHVCHVTPFDSSDEPRALPS